MKKLLLPFVLVGLFASCSTDDEPIKPEPVKPDPKSTALVISSVKRDNLARLDTVGVFLKDDSKVSSLVEYSGTTGGGTAPAWKLPSSSKANLLYDDKAEYKLFAFTPRNSTFDINSSLAMKPTLYAGANVVDQDFCYTYMSGISYNKPSVGLELKHLYSRITLKISTGDYQGGGKSLAYVKLSGPGIITNAIANFSDFSVAKIADTKIGELSFNTSNVSYDAAPISFLMIPSDTFTGPTNLTLNVHGTDSKVTDGIPVSGGNSLGQLKAGVNYEISVAVNNNFSLGVTQIVETPWR